MESVTLKTIRRFADRSKRLMSYINGLTDDQRNYAGKVYKSHRREYRRVFFCTIGAIYHLVLALLGAFFVAFLACLAFILACRAAYNDTSRHAKMMYFQSSIAHHHNL